MSRELHLTGFLKPAGEYLAGWRHPGNPRAAGVDFAFVTEQVRRLEAASFDAVFVPDLVGVPDAPAEVIERVAVVNDGFEPLTLLGALAAITSRIGLVATASTSYSEPYTVASDFASIDHLSKGRAGWNVVTSLNDSEARNYGLDAHLAHADRYHRAEEFVDLVFGLWDELDEGAVPQGRPIIAQAGSSGAGQTLATRVADLVFSRTLPLAEAQVFYAGVKSQVADAGRDPSAVLVLPELPTVVAPTRAQAEDEFAAVRDLLDARVALADVSYWLGVDLASLPLDAPLPRLPDTNRSAGAQAEIYAQALREGLSVRDLVGVVAEGDGAVIGSPQDVADHIERLFTEAAADGFTVSFPWQPGTLTAFTELVVPELQRRGLFRTDYEGTTLREHLGLARPGRHQNS